MIDNVTSRRRGGKGEDDIDIERLEFDEEEIRRGEEDDADLGDVGGDSDGSPIPVTSTDDVDALLEHGSTGGAGGEGDLSETLMFYAELRNTILKMLRENKIIDLETLTCLDHAQCVDTFRTVVRYAKTRGYSTFSPVFILQRERQLSFYSTLTLNTTLLTPFEKDKICSDMCLEALLTFFTAIENKLFITRLENVALLFVGDVDDSEMAIAKLICDLFRKPEDTPDRWLSRVEKIYRLIVGCAVGTIAQRELTVEALEL